MKVIINKKISLFDCIEVNDDNCGLICKNGKVEQNLYKKGSIYVLEEKSKEKTDEYISEGHICVFCKKGDVLIGNKDNGYTKPIAQFYKLSDEESEMLEEINNNLN